MQHNTFAPVKQSSATDDNDFQVENYKFTNSISVIKFSPPAQIYAAQGTILAVTCWDGVVLVWKVV